METTAAPGFTRERVKLNDPATASRVRLLAVVLVLTTLPLIVLGLLWQGPEETNELYRYTEIAPERDTWWGILMAYGVLLAVAVPLQALATMFLVQARGSRWATAGGVLLWFGAVFQCAGLAGWAAAYFFPTDPDVPATAGTAVIVAANADEAHLVALVPIGMALMVLGGICQAVGLFRAKVVPVWIPVAVLFVVLIFVVPGFGVASLITSLPQAAAACGLAWYAVRSVLSG